MFNWLKSKKAVPPPQTSQPVALGDGLCIHLKPFDLQLQKDSIPCWVYRSEGLRRLGQRELLFALPLGTGEPPQDPLYFTQFVGKFASEGQWVTVGGYTVFGPSHPGLFGRRDFRGVGYAHPYNLEASLPTDADPADYLAVIALTEPELESAQRYGLARTLARLGHEIRFFPYPVWSDPKRREVIDLAFIEASVLRGFAGTYYVDGFAPLHDQGVVRLRLSDAAARELASGISLAREKEVSLLVPTIAGWDQCAACLTWEPGSREPTAISGCITSDCYSNMQVRGESLLGCFLGFAITDDQGEGIKMIEDGFCMIVTAARAEEFVSALCDHRSFKLANTADLLPFEYVPA